MKGKFAPSILTGSLLLCGGFSCGGAEGNKQPAATGGAPQSAPHKGCVKIFDGKTFDGWEADPST